MAVNVVLNGVTYEIPDPGDNSWGQDLTDYFVAQATGLLQKSGGTFSLTSEVDFGATFGLKSAYFKSRGTNPATSGPVRLANTELISWRNAANSSNLGLTVNASDLLEFNGTAIQPAGTYISQLTGDVTAVGPGSSIATIGLNKVTNAKLAQMATLTIKGNNTGGTSDPLDLTVSQVNTMLGSLSNPMTTLGDTLYGGVSGVATRLAGDTSNTRKFLRTLSSAGTAAAPAWDTLVAGDIPNLAASKITSGQLALAQGGTNADLSATGGSHSFLKQASTGAAVTVVQPAFSDLSGVIGSTQVTTPTIQALTSTGSTTGYLFNVTSANATVGATYTNNGNTYTVLGTIASGTLLFCSGASVPLASGTLTKSAGTGDATITFSAKTALATYTKPANVLYLKVTVIGGGSGGGGSGTGASGTGSSAATASYFGANLLSCGGGGAVTAGAGGNLGGLGGSPTVASPAISLFSMTGGQGVGSSNFGASLPGGSGGGNVFNGAGVGTGGGSVGSSARSSSGCGGAGGGGTGSGSGAVPNAGGGAGGFQVALIPSPSATYPYIIGLKSTGGAAGTSGAAGGDGADGQIIVEEFYQ